MRPTANWPMIVPALDYTDLGPCPLCGGDVFCDRDCTGSWIDVRLDSGLLERLISVCKNPVCGSAGLYECLVCDWWCRYPSLRQEPDMGFVPQWIVDLEESRVVR